MNAIPNLAGVATSDLVDTIGTGKFQASYINWSRTMHLLRTHAPGWLPEIITAPDGSILHIAPIGAYMMIRFVNGDQVTPPIPQAVMDHTNKAIPLDRITARDLTDTHRRGVCLAAALTFGLAYELWAKMPLESGYSQDEERGPDVASILRNISNAQTLEILKSNYEAAMQMLDAAHHPAIKKATNARKAELQQKAEA